MTHMSPSSYQEYLRRRTQMASVPLSLESYAWYQQMQQSQAVIFDEARAAWLVFRYNEVQQVLLDPQTFSSQRDLAPDGTVDAITGGGLIGMDPPRHRILRTLVSQAFTPRVIARLQPRITAIVHALLDEMVSKVDMDIVDDLAFPLPITVITELLGIPSSDQEKFRQWATEFMGVDYAVRQVAAQKIAGYFQDLIVQRREDLGEDLVSDLLRAEVDGECLPDTDVVGTCLLLLNAGHETTVGLISNAVVCFDAHPDALQDLIAQPELLPSAIEEVLRYRAVVHTITRIAAADTVLAGQEIKAGDQVVPLFASANFDESQFPNAGTFDIRRYTQSASRLWLRHSFLPWSPSRTPGNTHCVGGVTDTFSNDPPATRHSP